MLKRIQRKIKRTFESQCLILCYHRVGNDVNDKWGNSISVDNFYSQMQIIKKYYYPISMDQLIQSKNNGILPEKKCVVVTFDDGYEINCQYALDILDKLDIPAIFYINTYLLDAENYFWWDIFQNIFYLNDGPIDSLTLEIENQPINLSFDTPNKKEHNIFLLHQLLKSLPPQERLSIIQQLERKVINGVSLGKEFNPITKNSILNISMNPIFEIGGHSHSHCSLSLIPKSIAKEEIARNKEILENITDTKIKHFSFPFGGEIDYNNQTLDFIKKIGYLSSVTTIRKPYRYAQNIFEIPRFSIKNYTRSIYKNKLENYLAYY